MTAVTARAAGVDRVVVASPGAPDAVLAAAAIAGADEFLAAGGAHAIAALAYGVDGLDRVDVIAGPGNSFVTAAKKIVSGDVGIDMLAGPSELLVIADQTADAGTVAADLLAQAEHDVEASAMLVTTDPRLADAVDAEIDRQLANLDTRDTAAPALANGFICVVRSLEEAAQVASAMAPEHLELLTERPREVAAMVRHAGAVFLGSRSAEVMGDYGAGPNHTLPTAGAARFEAGLSVMHFLRLRTWLELDRTDDQLLEDTVRLARIEGLSGHAAAAERRRDR
jgi:phosphoribosyl-ATP pyrophosphohydrolase/phosphoribosyl-AMP cyclohydrolase/histidinol dehydrogenase